MKRSALQKMNKGGLLELAVQRNLTLDKTLKKQELVDALHSSFAGAPAAHQMHPVKPSVEPSADSCGGPEPGMQETVEESRFYTGVPEQGAYAIPSELPYYYNNDNIVLLVRDPHWTFTYWEVTHGKLEAGMAQLGCNGSGSLTLRVYDVTDTDFNGHNAHNYNDIGVYERVGSWYVNTGRPGRSFIIDLGLKAPDGRFITLARSNVVKTPPDSVSSILDEEWVLPGTGLQAYLRALRRLLRHWRVVCGAARRRIKQGGVRHVVSGHGQPGPDVAHDEKERALVLVRAEHRAYRIRRHRARRRSNRFGREGAASP